MNEKEITSFADKISKLRKSVRLHLSFFRDHTRITEYQELQDRIVAEQARMKKMDDRFAAMLEQYSKEQKNGQQRDENKKA